MELTWDNFFSLITIKKKKKKSIGAVNRDEAHCLNDSYLHAWLTVQLSVSFAERIRKSQNLTKANRQNNSSKYLSLFVVKV